MIRRALVLVVAALLVATLAGCGSGGKSASTVPTSLRSSVDQQFRIVTVDGQRYVVGHGVEMKIPDSWVVYEPEKVGILHDTWEWAVGLPENTTPFPSGLQFSIGIPGQGTPYEGILEAARGTAEISPGYHYLDSGTIDVPGAAHASYLRFNRDLTLTNGKKFDVEQVSLFVDTGNGVSSTIRFIGGENGDWSKTLKSTYDSVTVAVVKGSASASPSAGTAS